MSMLVFWLSLLRYGWMNLWVVSGVLRKVGFGLDGLLCWLWIIVLVIVVGVFMMKWKLLGICCV